MRWLFKSIVILLLGLPVIVFVGWIYLQAQLKQAGISQWSAHFSQVSFHQLTLEALQFTLQQADYQLDVDLTELHVTWSWPAFFRIQPHSIALQSAQLNLHTIPAQQTEKNPTAFTLPAQWQLPSWLPKLIQLEQIQLTLPCGDKRCPIQAVALISGNELAQWQAKLQLISPEHQLHLQADFYYEHAANEKALQASVQLEQQLALSLKQHLNSQRQAKTELALSISPPSTALLAFLADWQLAIPTAWLDQFKQPVQLYAAGDWLLPNTLATTTSQALPLADADFRLIARAPDPFIVPGLGWLKGEITTQLTLSDHQLTQWQLAADLELTQYANTIVNGQLASVLSETFGSNLAPIHIKLKSGQRATAAATPTVAPATAAVAPTAVTWTQALPVNIMLSSNAPLQSLIEADLLLSLQPVLKLELQHGSIAIDAQSVNVASAQLAISDLQVRTALSGFWQASDWHVQLAADSQISGNVAHPQAQAKWQLQLANTDFTQHASNPVALHSQANLAISQLQQAQLVTQNWQWQAELSGTLRQLALKGELTNEKGLSLSQQLQWQAPGQFNLHWQLADIFLLAGNPLQSTVTAWPELLTLNRGRFNAGGQLQLEANTFSATALLQLRELNGLYDRTLFNGLSSQISLNLADDTLNIDIPSLQLSELNHGIQMGPVTVSAHYRASMPEPLSGKLQLNNVAMNFMQGELAVEPQVLDLRATEQELVLLIRQLDLAELLRQHPTTDLSANGKLSGRIPLKIKDKQFSVAQGVLAADQPGGRLQYRTAASAAGSGNPGMKLVFDALADFHFSVLSSEISYSHSGKLLLALQLQGANPAIQAGRPINLNINLEEDLPAMIASLQLANKLNDTLTKRVQQHIQRQQAAKAAAGENP